MSATGWTEPVAGSSVADRPGTITVVDVDDATAAIDLEGEFDMAGAPQITDVVTRLLADGKDLIVNLSAATFIDSAVVHALFDADADARAQNRSLVLQLDTEPGVARVLAITGADRALATAPSRQRALDAVRGRTSTDGAGR